MLVYLAHAVHHLQRYLRLPGRLLLWKDQTDQDLPQKDLGGVPRGRWVYLLGIAIRNLPLTQLVFVINQAPTLVCPQTHFTLDPREHPSCESYLLEQVPINFGLFSFSLQRLQIHAFVLSAFASIVGPFGGFFASGLKRSIKIKVTSSNI